MCSRALVSAPLGHAVRLTKDQYAKAEFHSTQRGVMLATSMTGSITGKGGNRLVIDDPHNPRQAESDLLREHALDSYRYTLSTRLDDKAHDAIVLTMQRLHEADLTGLCLDLGFEHLSLPAIATDRTTLTFPRTGRLWTREVGDVLWPERESREQLALQKQILGAMGFAAQYQQCPVPRAGGYFPPDRWRWYDDVPTQGEIIQSWDLAFKGTDQSDYVVGIVALRVGAVLYVLDRMKGKWTFPETIDAIRRMQERWPQTSRVLVEDAANGSAVVASLKEDVNGIIAVKPEGGKGSRAAVAQARVDAGQVYLPRPRTAAGVDCLEHGWVDDFVDVLARFPKGRYDDDVDAFTQLVVWCQQHPYVEPCHVTRDPEPFVKLRHSILPRRQVQMWGRPSTPWGKSGQRTSDDQRP